MSAGTRLVMPREPFLAGAQLIPRERAEVQGIAALINGDGENVLQVVAGVSDILVRSTPVASVGGGMLGARRTITDTSGMQDCGVVLNAQIPRVDLLVSWHAGKSVRGRSRARTRSDSALALDHRSAAVTSSSWTSEICSRRSTIRIYGLSR